MKRENYAISALRLFGAFAVILIHVGFPGIVGTFALALSRFAVPMFFAISGYFFYTNSTEQAIARAKRHALSTLRVIILASALFFMLTVLRLERDPAALREYLGSVMSLRALINIFIFNMAPGEGHIWFLQALLYVYLFMLGAHKLGDKFANRFIAFAPALFLIQAAKTIATEYGAYPFFGWHIELNVYSRGLPYFCVGCLICRYHAQLNTFVRSHKRAALVATAALFFSQITEAYLYLNFSVFAFTAALMIVATTLGEDARKSLISEAGKRYSLVIYIIHIIFIYCVASFSEVFDFAEAAWYLWTRPLIVFALTLAFSIGLEWINSDFWNVKR